MKNRSKEEIEGRGERHFIFRGGRKIAVLLEGSHATLARPSHRNNVKVKTLGDKERLQTDNGILNF
jgi:hypothetical protein